MPKIDELLQDGNHYEAHQQIRTVFNRLKRQKKWSEAKSTVHDGALKLLQAKQYSSGADLSQLYVQTLKDSKTVPSAANAAKFLELFDAFGDSLKLRDECMKAYLNYCNYHPSVCHEYGLALSNDDAAKFLLRGTNESAIRLAGFDLQDGAKVKYLLSYMANGQVALARTYWSSLDLKGSELNVNGHSAHQYEQDVFNFGEIMLVAVENKASVKVFNKIKQVNKAQVGEFEDLVQQVGQKHFGVQAQQNLFSQFMK